MFSDWNGTEVIANLTAPDLYADEAATYELKDGVVKITLATQRLSDGLAGSPYVFVIQGRLIMGQEAALRLASGLFHFLKGEGVDPQSALNTFPLVQ